MGFLEFILGATVGAVSTYYLKKKQKTNINNQSINTNSISDETKLKNEIKELEIELEKHKSQNKKLKAEIDNLDDKNDDSDTEITNLKRSNDRYFQENEKMKAEILEYEMLYKARKQEIEELKNKLNK